MSHRDWMYLNLNDKTNRALFANGVQEFLDFAFSHPECVDRDMIRCPSTKCDFSCYKTRESVRICLLRNGFVSDYKTWNRHGESDIQMENNFMDEGNYESWANEMITEAFGPNYEPLNENPNAESKMFYNMFESANEPLWKGCKSDTILSAVSQILHFKSEYGIPIKGVDQILSFIKRLLPEGNKLPDTFYQCKVMMKGLGLPCEKIHACENDCILFWKKNVDLQSCPVCGESRYKVVDDASKGKRKPVPRKVLRYFPLIPRLLRLFLSSKTAEHMRWHGTKRMNVEGELRHPADGEAWKHFDRTYESFAADFRNIRLGLATDGFNPFGHSSKPHSTWPVFIVPYNLPPWMCMKPEYMFLSLVIPGPKGPGRELDVYLEPLIDELKTLWTVGVDAYDISLKQNFKMRAALLWTISDFPAYGMLSGWSTHGKNSCPCCLDTSIAFNLKEGKKPCYFGCHRRWLNPRHRWRSDKQKFNNKTERREAPRRQSGEEILAYVSKFESITLGKGRNSDEKTHGFGVEHNWTKKSIFFELPYWRKLLIRHNLDLMHIEKNVFDNVFNTVMNVKGKTKDNLKSRMDMKFLGIRPELHPIERPNKNPILPKSKYTLTNEQIKLVYEWLQLLKVPDQFAGNFSRCVNPRECKISGLKTHDCHVLMERFLPLAFREFLPKDVWEPLNALSHFFRDICSKVYKEEELEKLELGIIETLCKLEMIFPPSFFDSMEHLPIHLAYEAKLGGPVQYRWMYPFERCMQYLKKKVRNKACPEGSIAEAYWIEEIVNFCSHYFDSRILTKFNRPDRNDDGGPQELTGGIPVFTLSGRPFGKARQRWLSSEEVSAIALYVLLNCDYDKAYEKINEHREMVKDLRPDKTDAEVDQEHYASLVKWFEKSFENDDDINLRILAEGPHRYVTCYNGFNVNGFRFHAKKLERTRATQNSGVLIKGTNYGNEEKDYYGHLEEAMAVGYYGGKTVYLFKCEWYDPIKGVEKDKYGFTKVNTRSRLRSYEPFVIASQAVQVFYASSVSKKNDSWFTVIPTKARNTYDVVENEEDDDADTYQENDIHVNLCDFDQDVDNFTLRDDTHPGYEVELHDDNEDAVNDDDDDSFNADSSEDDSNNEEEEDIFTDDDGSNHNSDDEDDDFDDSEND